MRNFPYGKFGRYNSRTAGKYWKLWKNRGLSALEGILLKTFRITFCMLLALALLPTMAEVPAGTASAPTPETMITATPAPTGAGIVEANVQDDGIVRVELDTLGRPETLHLKVQGSYAVEDDAGFRFEDGAEITLLAREDRLWLVSGKTMIDMGESLTLTRHAAAGRSGLYIAESAVENLYCGDLSVTAGGGALRAILSIDIEEYLLGVVAYEMSDSFPLEALKAQAVAARTYVMQRKEAYPDREYHVLDTTSDQVFKGFDPSYTNVIAAVEATRGVVGTYQGVYASCYYGASNGGQVARAQDVWSMEGDYGYITMHDDPYDLENPSSLVASATVSRDLSDHGKLRTMLETEVKAELGEGYDIARVENVEPVDALIEGSRLYQGLRFDLTVLAPGEESGGLFGWWKKTRPEEALSVTLSVFEQLKDGLAIGLNSSDCELVSVVMEEKSFTVEMRRFGHGVGMSQRGAEWMAKEYGLDWITILNFYYPGMTLERIDWQIPALTALEEMPTVSGYARPEPTPRPTPVPLPAPQAGEKVASVRLEDESAFLNVRQGPSTGHMIVDRFAHGREVLVCSEPDDNGWVRIRTAELTGYVMGTYLGIG